MRDGDKANANELSEAPQTGLEIWVIFQLIGYALPVQRTGMAAVTIESS